MLFYPSFLTKGYGLGRGPRGEGRGERSLEVRHQTKSSRNPREEDTRASTR